MEKLYIKGDLTVPEILLDVENQVFCISGKSAPENVSKVYLPVNEWLDKYEKNPLPKTTFDFKFTYYNTASAKMILNLMVKLETILDSGYDMLVRWHYHHDDEDMEEAGEDYANIVNIPFEFIKY